MPNFVFILFVLVHSVVAHVTVSPIAGACSSPGCLAGSTLYLIGRMPHAVPGSYTYKFSIRIPNQQYVTIKPKPVPGWVLNFNPDTDPNNRWIDYTAYPGFEVYDKWLFQFGLQVSIKCGTTQQSGIQYNDDLIVPMGSFGNESYFGLLLPIKQYFCSVQGSNCVPNGLFEEWAGYTNTSYDAGKCGTAAALTPGSCDASCRGSTVPCVSFKLPQSCQSYNGISSQSYSTWNANIDFPSIPAARDFTQVAPFFDGLIAQASKTITATIPYSELPTTNATVKVQSSALTSHLSWEWMLFSYISASLLSIFLEWSCY